MSFKDLSSPRNTPAKYKSDDPSKSAPAAEQPSKKPDPDKAPAKAVPAPKS